MTGKDEKMGRRDFLKIASGGIAAILNFRKFPLVYSGTTKKVDSFDMSTAAAKDILKEDGIIVMGSDGCTGIAFNPNDPDYVYFSQLDGDSTRIMASDCRDFNRSKPEQACFMTRDMQIYDPRVLPETMSSISFSPDGYKMAMVNMKKNEIHIHDFTDSRNVRVKRIDKYEALITLRNYKEDFSPFWWDDGEILFEFQIREKGAFQRRPGGGE